MRNLFIILSITTFLLLNSFASEAMAEQRLPDSAGKRFDMATYRYNNLSFNRGEKSRDRWLQCVKSLKTTYQHNPSHSKAPLAIFTLASMFEEMHNRFHDPHYLDEAAGYYEDLATIFPKNDLADDALLNLGNISITKQNNGKKAEKIFARIIAVYPDGDMAQAAALMLRQSKESKGGNGSAEVLR